VSGDLISAPATGVLCRFVGHPFDDPTVFRIGAAIELGQPWPLVVELGAW
jgi:hypothetical protein